MDTVEIHYNVFIYSKQWLLYTRRPHFSELSKFGKLNIIENPLVILSSKFLKSIRKSIYYYVKYSKGIRKDILYNAEIIKPIILFSDLLRDKYPVLNKIDLFLLGLQINKMLPDKKQVQQVYVLTNKSQEWLIKKSDTVFYILDMNDEWSMINYDETSRTMIESKIRNIIKKVNMVTTVTKRLQSKYDINGKAIFLPNAVNISHYVPSFDIITKKGKELPVEYEKDFIKIGESDPRKYLKATEELKNIKRPAVGSISGLSGNWSDFEFMSRVEELLPAKFTLVSSGNIFPPTKNEFIPGYKKYVANQRMIFLEHLDYSILPDFLENIDIGIVMHRMDEFNKHSAPNKIWAYLAMGLPVVSTNFLDESDKEIYEGLVYFAGTPGEYVSVIIKAFEEDNQYLKNKRRDLAIKYSTYNRAKRLHNMIQERLRYVWNSWSNQYEVSGP